eukprot:4779536-Karenia_brevis.AAC.1
MSLKRHDNIKVFQSFEIDGTLTQDRKKWLEEAHRFGSQRFGDSSNSYEVQHQNLKNIRWAGQQCEEQLDVEYWDIVQSRAGLGVGTAPG